MFSHESAQTNGLGDGRHCLLIARCLRDHLPDFAPTLYRRRCADVAGLPPNDAPSSDQVDILTFAKSHPPYPGSYQQTAPPGGSLHDCMYYDCDVERAAEFSS